MKDISIYVLGHTRLPFLFADSYYPMIRGMRRQSVRSDIMLADETGDNISTKEYMADLIFLYWIWKNTVLPTYVGVCHYRRYFNFSGEKLKVDGSNFLECVTASKAVKLLQTADVILLPPNSGAYTRGVAGYFFKCHPSKYMFLAFKVICRRYPEYRSSFIEVMDSNIHHARSIFVTKKEIFCQLMEFLTSVLFEVEEIALKKYPNEIHQERFLGYIHERLMEVFWNHNKLRIKECNLIQLSLDTCQ